MCIHLAVEYFCALAGPYNLSDMRSSRSLGPSGCCTEATKTFRMVGSLGSRGWLASSSLNTQMVQPASHERNMNNKHLLVSPPNQTTPKPRFQTLTSDLCQVARFFGAGFPKNEGNVWGSPKQGSSLLGSALGSPKPFTECGRSDLHNLRAPFSFKMTLGLIDPQIEIVTTRDD